MPLTIERPGLFRGRRDNADAWYAVDPVGGEPLTAVISAWHDRYAATNSSRVRRVIAWTVGWTTFLTILVAPIVVAGSFFGDTELGGLANVGSAVAGLVGGTWAAVSLHARILPRATLDGPAPSRVRKVDTDVLAWAADTTDAADIWELNLALTKVRQMHTAIAYWGGEWDYDYESADRPDDAISQVIEPALLNAFHARRAELRDVAARLGFTIPDAVDGDPESLSNYAAK